MTHELKAKELVEKFKIHCYCYLGSGMLTNTYDEKVQTINAKQCAIIAVDEILLNGGDFTGMSFGNEEMFIDRTYWEQVKQEIEKL